MDKKILLQNVAESLAERTGLTKRKAEAFVRSFFDLTEEALIADGQVKVKSYGTTKVVKVNNRESVNINTGERFQIEGHAKISFTPDAPFRDLVNRPFAHFTTIILEDGVDDKEILAAAAAETSETENEEAGNTLPTIEELENSAIRTATETRAAESQHAGTEETTSQKPATETTPAEATHAEVALTEATRAEAVLTETAHAEAAHAETATAENAVQTATEAEAEAADEPVEEDLIIEHGEEDLTAEERKEDAEAKSEAPIEGLKDLEEEGDEDLQNSESQHAARTSRRSPDEGNPPIIINNTIPTPLHNGWKTAFVILLTLILVLASYFAGYFRLFCPCNLFGTDAEEIECNDITHTVVETNTDSIQRADSINKAKADSVLNAAKRAEEQARAAQQAAQQAAMQQAAAQKAAQQAAAQQAAAQRAAQREQERQKELQAAQKYPQMTNSKYLITGVLRTRRIHKGENLYMIAKQTYGSKYFARYISFHNNIEDPNLVTEGQVIQIPRLTKR